MRLSLAALVVVLSASAAAADEVFSRFAVKENASVSSLLQVSSDLSTATGKWSLRMGNSRAHGDEMRKFGISLDNGRRAGFCKLIGLMRLEVNGYSSRVLQLKRNWVREYADGKKKGVEFALNFDGAVVRTRFWMSPDSPRLWAEVRCSEKSLEPVTNIVVSLTTLPSFLEVVNGKSRFGGYRRAVRTASRYLEPCKRAAVSIRPDDRYFICQDEDYDGSAKVKGVGPSAVFLDAPCEGRICLSDGWLTELRLSPDPAKPLRFSLLEYTEERVSNEEFARRITNMSNR